MEGVLSMKEQYEELALEVIEFDGVDVITNSDAEGPKT